MLITQRLTHFQRVEPSSLRVKMYEYRKSPWFFASNKGKMNWLLSCKIPILRTFSKSVKSWNGMHQLRSNNVFNNIMLCFQELTNAIVTSLPIAKQDQPPDLLGPIIKPFTELIIQIDKKVSNYCKLILRNTKHLSLVSGKAMRNSDIYAITCYA